MQRGPVAEDVLAAISDRATALFQSQKHKALNVLTPESAPYALASVAAMLGLNMKQVGKQPRCTLSKDVCVPTLRAVVATSRACRGIIPCMIPTTDEMHLAHFLSVT
jgi:glutamate/tyrosine decarboxylase-like PLP-dependent enzyme